MRAATRSFVGRDHELEELGAAVRDARDGRGDLLLVSGEPGIGKSRLLEEVARSAAETGLRVLWGRSWEAGGAPAFWPLIQVLRGLLPNDPRERAALLSEPAAQAWSNRELTELLPELHGAAQPAAPELPPEQARFRLMDAVSRALRESAARVPLLIILEDLHAADLSSILLLDFLSHTLRRTPLLVIGSYREADAQRSALGPLLARLAASHTHLRLERLDRAQVAQHLERLLGRAPDPALCEAVFTATEGNPLFIAEIARLQARLDPSALGHAPPLPSGIRAVIRTRLQTLSEPTREVLSAAAVLGRESRSALLAELCAASLDAIARPIDEAAEAEVLLEVAPGQLRFSHILLQQVLYADLALARRQGLHERVAELLAGETGDPTGAERAHHLLAGGPALAARAVEAACAAARKSAELHALDETAELYRRALEAQQNTPQPDAARCDLLLELGHAQITAHRFSEGRATCERAAALARALGDPERFARAALALGAVYIVADVDAGLVERLRSALELLPDRDHALRARVMARLSAALQPAADPRPPIAMAREAVGMARRLGDEPTLLSVLDSAISSMIDLADAGEARPLEEEQLQLAERLGSRVTVFRAHVRIAVSSYELGDFARVERALRGSRELARELAQPHYAWRASALAAAHSLWCGDFAAAEQQSELARQLGAEAGDPNAARSCLMQQLLWLRLRGRFAALVEALPLLARSAPNHPQAQVGAAIVIAGERIRLGQLAAARQLIEPHRSQLTAALHDATAFDNLAEIAALLGDRELLEQVYARGAGRAGQWVSGGVYGLTFEQPVERGMAKVAIALGRFERAEHHFGAALAQLEAAGAVALRSWVLFEYAVWLSSRAADSASPEAARAAGLAEHARALALRLDIQLPWPDQLLAAAAAPPSAADPQSSNASALPDVAYLRLTREGDYWTVECEGRSFKLKDGKGVAILARLLEEPGRELHVLDLVGADGAIDRGDAGAWLDPSARAQYQARVEALRAELEEAERWSDAGRAERAQRELDMIGQELARALGVGGRSRRSGSAAERARVNVQRRLRDTLTRIASHDPALGRHLEWAIRTGSFCSYRRP